MIKKLNWSIPQLNAFFSDIAETAESVFWIRSADYKEQIYLSPNFTSYWARPVNQLYQHPESFIETIIDNTNTAKSILSKRSALLTESEKKWESMAFETVLFQVNRSDNQTVFVKDRAFLLKDKKTNEPVAISGFGYVINREEWLLEKEGEKVANYRIHMEQAFIKLIEKVLHLAPLTQEAATIADQVKSLKKREKIQLCVSGQEISFGLREIQCLYYSTQGLSAKQIGNRLCLSPRTVETYLEQMKLKLNCRTKLELFSKFNSGILEILKECMEV